MLVGLPECTSTRETDTRKESSVCCCSYEAPNFVPLAPEKQDWRFATHTQEEGPERVFLGVVESGYTTYVHFTFPYPPMK